MRTRAKSIGQIIMTAAVLALIGPGVAEAKIRCNGPFQVVKGHGQLATPFCEDGYLAKVARGYGVRISAAVIRRNPNRKAEVCKLVGHDTRVSDICSQYNDFNGRDRW